MASSRSSGTDDFGFSILDLDSQRSSTHENSRGYVCVIKLYPAPRAITHSEDSDSNLRNPKSKIQNLKSCGRRCPERRAARGLLSENPSAWPGVGCLPAPAHGLGHRKTAETCISARLCLRRGVLRRKLLLVHDRDGVLRAPGAGAGRGGADSLCLIDATFFGGFGLAMGWAARRSPGWALAASPFLWMAMELARTYLITGFPWNLLGYAVQAPGVRQIATVTGVYGLSFLAVATSALLAWVLLSPRRARAGLALTVWIALLFIAQWRLAPPPATVGKELAVLVQPNVPLDDDQLEAGRRGENPAQLQQLVQFSVDAVAIASLEIGADAGQSRNPKSEIQNPSAIGIRRCWSGRKTPRRSSSPATRCFATPWKTWRGRRTPS